jgi:four helix bundle protein
VQTSLKHGENASIKNHFVSKLTDCEAEAGETQVWLDFALEFEYIDKNTYDEINNDYEHIIGMLISMSSSPDSWLIK